MYFVCYLANIGAAPVDALEKMVADAPISKARLDELAQIFRQTTELEIAFWDTAMAAATES